MECVPLKLTDAFDARQLWPIKRSIGHRDKTGTHCITAIGSHNPVTRLLIPFEPCHFRLETCVFIEVVLFADVMAMRQDLRRVGVFLFRDKPELFAQR